MANIIICKRSDKVFTDDEIEHFIDSKANEPGKAYLMLRQISCNTSKISFMESIIELLIQHKQIKWRHLKVILPHYKTKEKKDFFDFYKKNIYPLIPIEEKLILGIAEIYPELLDLYLDKYLVVDKMFKTSPSSLPKVDYSFLLKQIENFIKKKFSKKGLAAFLRVFPKEKDKYDLVFDGNNILLNKKGILKIESFKKLNTLVVSAQSMGYNPVVFIHARHLKTLKRMGLKIPFTYISTLYRYNDDWFSLYYAIKNDIPLVSRDIFRDHINQFDTQNKTDFLKIFLHNKKLNINEDFSEIQFEQKNIPIIFKKMGNYYIPGNKGYMII